MPRGRKKKVHDTFAENPQPFLLPETEFDYVDKAVERVKIAWGFHHMMNPDGKPMLMAFSGGKDSICLFFVCKKAAEELGVPMEQMFHVQYNVTNVDPPELYRFIRDVMKKQYPFIEIHHPKKTMWQLIVEKHLPPLRATRYCCAELKEVSSIKGGYTLTGVRHAESPKRANREFIEIRGKNRKDAVYLGDNVEDEREIRYCMQTESYICNPIIDWSDEDVWRFIRRGGVSVLFPVRQGMASPRLYRLSSRWRSQPKKRLRGISELQEAIHTDIPEDAGCHQIRGGGYTPRTKVLLPFRMGRTCLTGGHGTLPSRRNIRMYSERPTYLMDSRRNNDRTEGT